MKKNAPEDAAGIAGKPFEEALRELEAVVESLEQGDAPLETLIEKYETGMRLHARCQSVLRDAELRIEQLRSAPDGSVSLEPAPAGAGDGTADDAAGDAGDDDEDGAAGLPRRVRPAA